MDQDEPKKKTIDERLEALVQSVELIAGMQLKTEERQAEERERAKRLEERDHQHRLAILAAMKAYLEALNGEK